MAEAPGTGKEVMLGNAPARKGISRRCKCCIGCSVATVVVLAVAIPVGIFVVGPNLAQQAIDMSTLHIHHSNIFDVPDSGVNGTMYNKITIHSPMIFSATMEEMTVTMVADQPDPSPYGFTNGPFGNFTMPKMKVNKGNNGQDWTTEVLFNRSADDGFRFVFWTYMVTNLAVARMNLTSEPKVKSFGLSFNTKMTKQLVCNCLESTGCVPQKQPFNGSKVEAENSRRLVGTIAPIYLYCEPIGTDVHNGSQWNNSAFMGAAIRLSSMVNRFLA